MVLLFRGFIEPKSYYFTFSRSKWSKVTSGVKVVPIVISKETFSPGDALRDIYARGIISSDFVLVTGDLVSNIRIDEIVREHKERRKKHKDIVMTMVVKASGASHRTRFVIIQGTFIFGGLLTFEVDFVFQIPC